MQEVMTDKTWETEINAFQKNGLSLLGFSLESEFSQQITTLHNELSVLKMPEGTTDEETKKTLALSAILEATKLFFAKLNGLAQDLDSEKDLSKKIEMMEEIIDACSKFKDKLDAVSCLSDTTKYMWQVAVVAVLTALTLFCLRLAAILLITHFCPLAPATVGFLYFCLAAGVGSDMNRAIVGVMDARKLLEDTLYPVPGSKRWDSAVKDWFASFSDGNSNENGVDPAENKANEGPGLFVEWILSARRFLFGDFGLFLGERKSGFAIADSIEEMAKAQRMDLYMTGIQEDIQALPMAIKDGFDEAINSVAGFSFSSLFSDVQLNDETETQALVDQKSQLT